MVQIKTGHENPVGVVLGPNCRPPNNSQFRNLKCLEIDKVVSQKLKKKERRKGKKGREGGRRQETTQKICQLTRIPYLERRDKCIKNVKPLCRLMQ